MSHEFESGFMVNTPSWHRLENAVLSASPRTWEEARTQAGLDWDVYADGVFVGGGQSTGKSWTYDDVSSEWQAIRRDDTEDVLSIRPATYQMVTNSQFGSIMESLLGLEKEEELVFEALMSLYGGRQVVALTKFEEPLRLPWDESETYAYLAFSSRHDGQGGIRGIPTNVRVVCANTLSLAESMGKDSSFSIRHTTTWEDRVAEIGDQLRMARQGSKRWVEGMEALARFRVQEKEVDTFLRKLFPISDEMTGRMIDSRQLWRTQVRRVYEESETTNSVRGNGYGLLMATTEWADHVREARTDDSAVSRQLLTKSEPKAKAARILAHMAS